MIVRKNIKGNIAITVNFNHNDGTNFVFRICPVTDEKKDCLKEYEMEVVESKSVIWSDPTR